MIRFYEIFFIYRASRGKNLTVAVRVLGPGGRGFDEVDVFTHINETPAGLRRQVNYKLFCNCNF